MDSPTPGRRQVADHVLDHPEQRLDLFAFCTREGVRREDPQRDDRYSQLVATLEERFELVSASLIARHERLVRSVGTRPAAIAVSEHGDMPWQSLGVQ